MEKKKLKVEIEIWGIEVEQTYTYANSKEGEGWYKFEYSYRINGGKKKFGQEDGSWSSQTKAHFKRILNNGYAARKVLERLV